MLILAYSTGINMRAEGNINSLFYLNYSVVNDASCLEHFDAVALGLLYANRMSASYLFGDCQAFGIFPLGFLVHCLNGIGVLQKHAKTM
jgi:hypothetical protein